MRTAQSILAVRQYERRVLDVLYTVSQCIKLRLGPERVLGGQRHTHRAFDHLDFAVVMCCFYLHIRFACY